MVFAHQGLETKPPFGVAPLPAPAPSAPSTPGAVAQAAPDAAQATPQPIGLSPRATRAILDIGNLTREALKSSRTSAAPEAERDAPPTGVAVNGKALLRPEP
jgi:hypothetical protein